MSDVERAIKEAQANLRKSHKQQEIYYNMERRVLEIKVVDKVLLESHFLSLKAIKQVAKFRPKFVGPYEVLGVHNNNLILSIKGERVTVNMDHVRVYKEREGASSFSGNSAYPPPPSSSDSSHFRAKGLKISSHKPTLRPKLSNGITSDRTSPGHRQCSRRINQQQSTPMKGLKRPVSSNEIAGSARRKIRCSHRHEHPVSSSDSAALSRTRLRQHRKWKGSPLTEPPVATRKSRTSTFRPLARKRKLSSATSTTRGHVEKSYCEPSASSRTSIPRHNYKTRL